MPLPYLPEVLLTLLAAFVFSRLILRAHHGDQGVIRPGREQVKPGDNAVIEKTLGPDITGVVVEVPGDVYWTKESAGQIRVEGSEWQLKKLALDEVDGILYVRSQPGTAITEALDITLALPKARSMSVTGEVCLTMDDIHEEDLVLTVRHEAEVSGEGEIERLTLHAEGNVSINLDELGSGHLTAVLHTDCDVDVHATQSAVIELRGDGDVSVYGEPEKREIHIFGRGSVDFC